MFSSHFRHRQEPNVEIDMVPIMNMFLVLIPFLLISSSFLHLKAINTSVPVKASSSSELSAEQSEIALTMMVSLLNERIEVHPSSADLSDAELQTLDFVVERSQTDAFERVTAGLAQLKQQYPNSETLILSPDDSVPYADMVKLMDAARGPDPQQVLFAKVVISGLLK